MKVFLLLAKILLPVVLILAIIIAVPALKSKKKAVPESHTFYYYPKANVYFNTDEHQYIYLDSTGQEWQISSELPDYRKAGLDRNFTLYSPVQPVWKDNELHRMVYAVALYALPSDVIEEKPEPLQEPDYTDSSPRTESSGPDKKKKESGIKRFFRKLFGGKNKD